MGYFGSIIIAWNDNLQNELCLEAARDRWLSEASALSLSDESGEGDSAFSGTCCWAYIKVILQQIKERSLNAVDDLHLGSQLEYNYGPDVMHCCGRCLKF